MTLSREFAFPSEGDLESGKVRSAEGAFRCLEEDWGGRAALWLMVLDRSEGGIGFREGMASGRGAREGGPLRGERCERQFEVGNCGGQGRAAAGSGHSRFPGMNADFLRNGASGAHVAVVDAVFSAAGGEAGLLDLAGPAGGDSVGGNGGAYRAEPDQKRQQEWKNSPHSLLSYLSSRVGRDAYDMIG